MNKREMIDRFYMADIRKCSPEELIAIAEQYAAACVTDVIEKSLAFKKYVHKRLDDAGIPVDPESPRKTEGYRIGGRLDCLLSSRDKLRESLVDLIIRCETTVEVFGEQDEIKSLTSAKSLLAETAGGK